MRFSKALRSLHAVCWLINAKTTPLKQGSGFAYKKGNNILDYTLVMSFRVKRSVAKNLENIKDVHVDAHEILPPFGRLNDK